MIIGLSKYFVIFFLSLWCSFLLTPFAIKWCTRCGMVDCPDERRIHKNPIPRGGGLAIILSFFLGCVGISVFPYRNIFGHEIVGLWARFFLPVLILMLVGVLDDRKGLRPSIKLGGQFLAAALTVMLGLRIQSIFGWPLPLWLDAPLCILVILGFINAFNLIDGIDGLATGLALIAALGMMVSFIFQQEPINTMIMLALAGACLGFLRYNFFPAKIFLGDTGSMFLGYILALFALRTCNKSTTVIALGLPFLAAGIPLLDTMLAIWRRSLRRILNSGTGELSRADMDHLHHRLMKTGLTQRRVALILYAISAAFVLTAVFALYFRDVSIALMVVAVGVGTYIIVRHLVFLELIESSRLIKQWMKTRTSSAWRAAIFPVVDVVILLIGLLIGLYTRAMFNGDFLHREALLQSAPFMIGVPVIALVTGRMYQRVWYTARAFEYVFLIFIGVFSCLLGVWLWAPAVSAGPHAIADLIAAVLIFTIPGLVMVRAAPHLIVDVSSWLQKRIHAADKGTERVLVYGAGTGFFLFLLSGMRGYSERHDYSLVGLLDDRRSLTGRYIYGHRVLGGREKLESIIEKQNPTQIVITTTLDSPVIDQVLAMAARHGISVYQWHSGLKKIHPDDPC